MASFDVTKSAVFIPEVWSKMVIVARDANRVMANLVRRLDADVSQSGDTIHVPNLSLLTAAAIGADGSLADSAVTETEVQISINKWYGVSINIPDIVKAQSDYNLMSYYSERMGNALGLQRESDLLALYDGLSTNSVGSNGVDLTDANLRLSVQKLDDANAPFDDRHAVIKPAQWNALLGIDKFVRQDAVGSGEAIRNAKFGNLYGVDFYKTTLVPTTSGETKNLMFHRDAFCLAEQKGVAMEKFARTQFSDRMGSSILYGIGELRDDHGVKLKS